MKELNKDNNDGEIQANKVENVAPVAIIHPEVAGTADL
jgi:hypothetical protein